MKIGLLRKAKKILGADKSLLKTRPTKANSDEHNLNLVRDFIDAEWYRSTYIDVDFEFVEPAAHYLAVGAKEHRAPHPLFDTDWYIQQSPDLQDSDRNPLLHFLTRDDRSASAHPLFDGAWYLEQNADVRASGMNALKHYIRHGAKEGRSPHPLFDVPYYRERNAGQHFDNPLLHYLSGHGTSPHPLFDEAYYRRQIPSLDFHNIPLLLHFVLRGAVAGYNPNRFFDCLWYVGNHENLQETGENPLVHFLRAGLQEGRDPHPLFDLDWYLFAHPDVARSGLNPLQHYLASGETEGRRCRPADATDANCAVLDIPYEILRNPLGIAGRDVCIFVTYSRSGTLSPHV